MAILEILKYPDKKLRIKSKEVDCFDENLHRLLDDMYETMNDRGGVGLAAIQVGIPKRVFIVNVPKEGEEEAQKQDLIEIINPVFLKKENIIKWNEGCLSVPDFYEEIERFESITLAYQNRFGEKQILQAKGLLSVAFQHENDHLDGILFIDKLPILRRKKFEKELKRIQKESKKNPNKD